MYDTYVKSIVINTAEVRSSKDTAENMSKPTKVDKSNKSIIDFKMVAGRSRNEGITNDRIKENYGGYTHNGRSYQR